jgi:hypothetical protein
VLFGFKVVAKKRAPRVFIGHRLKNLIQTLPASRIRKDGVFHAGGDQAIFQPHGFYDIAMHIVTS